MKMEQVSPNLQEKMVNNKNNLKNSNFDRLLKHPAEESAKDTYYWKHQNHLQHSDLEFNALRFNTSFQYLEKSENLELSYKAASIASPRIIVNRNSQITHIHPPKPHHEYLDKISGRALIIKTHNLYLGKSDSCNKKLTQQNSKIIYKNLEIKAKEMDWKNHHIYWGSDGVEITINTQTFNTTQKNALINQLKEMLAAHNLRLNKLIINGEIL